MTAAANPSGRRALNPTGYAESSAPYSSVILSNNFAFISGQVPLTPAGDLVGTGFEEQLEQVFANLDACLQVAGCAISDIVKVTVYLTDKEDLDSLNALYRRRFLPPRPARTTIQAGLMMGFRVEIDAIAAVP